MKIKTLQIDAFTDRPFAGNPAAVCLLEESQNQQISDQQRQSIAAEMNLAETAFVVPDGDRFQLRWFTPCVEVDLCGHATLASAHALWSEGVVDSSRAIVFNSRSGDLTCKRIVNAKNEVKIELDFPALPIQEAGEPDGLLDSLGIDAVSIIKSSKDYLVHGADEATVRSCKPDFAKLADVETRGVIITAEAAAATKAEKGYDFVSRFFAPAAGINEDPVTGSAHCALAPFWCKWLGKSNFSAYQASARGGELDVVLAGDRVRLSGNAVTVLRGELLL